VYKCVQYVLLKFCQHEVVWPGPDLVILIFWDHMPSCSKWMGDSVRQAAPKPMANARFRLLSDAPRKLPLLG